MESKKSHENLAFDPNDAVVHCECAGGATLQSGNLDKSILKLINGALAFRPDIIFLHIGENDVGKMSQHAIAEAIMALLYYISAVSEVKLLICSELVPMPKFQEQLGCDPAECVRATNIGLEAAIEVMMAGKTTRMKVEYWKYEMGLNRVEANLFAEKDRTHLNERGMEKYFRSVRAAIGRRLNTLH